MQPPDSPRVARMLHSDSAVKLGTRCEAEESSWHMAKHDQHEDAEQRMTFFQFGDQDMNRHGAKTAYDGYQWLLVAIKSLMVINGYC